MEVIRGEEKRVFSLKQLLLSASPLPIPLKEETLLPGRHVHPIPNCTLSKITDLKAIVLKRTFSLKDCYDHM